MNHEQTGYQKMLIATVITTWTCFIGVSLSSKPEDEQRLTWFLTCLAGGLLLTAPIVIIKYVWRLRQAKTTQTQLAPKTTEADTDCPNCTQPLDENCACMRNQCKKCGNIIGNIARQICDSCELQRT